MRRATVWAALAACLSWAQNPRFEAAAIHPVSPAESGGSSGCRTTPGLMQCTNVTLKRCIAGAYDVGQDRVLGGPDWAGTDRFQIVARSDRPVGDKGLMAMLQTLLADRFKLALHRESRSMEAMVLEVERHGPKKDGPKQDQPKIQSADPGSTSWNNMHDHLQATRITMDEFAGILSRDLKLPVVDPTDLPGAYSFTLRWDPEVTRGLERDEAMAALRAEVAAAIARQMGLTLKFRKMPVEMLVIDGAEKPSEN
jgi:uncharacterized protein (TIGR03435 family)